jgi:hypothetical protein
MIYLAESEQPRVELIYRHCDPARWKKDAWTYRWGCYRHPEVRDEKKARHRLLDLGLHTSRWLQIDFIRDDFLYPFR